MKLRAGRSSTSSSRIRVSFSIRATLAYMELCLFSYDDHQSSMYASLARMLKDTLMRLDEVLDRPALNFMIHTSPIGEEINDHYHWHIEIIPKLTKVAGFEWGTGFYINPTPPEESARFLREAKIPTVSEKK